MQYLLRVFVIDRFFVTPLLICYQEENPLTFKNSIK